MGLRKKGGKGGKKETEAEGGARESWDPPARDFLPLMYFPQFFFLLFLYRKVISPGLIAYSLPVREHCTQLP